MNMNIVQFDFLPIRSERGIHHLDTEPVEDCGDFLSCLKGLTNSTQNRSLTKAHSYYYLESLRKGLLSKGGSLQRISLRLEDFSLLQTFLFHCGFSQEEVKGLARELLEGNPSREINLQQFIRKVTKHDTLNKNCHQPVILDPSAVPYLESALRYFGLTQERLGQAFGAARTQGGGIDLDQFVTELKEISERITGGDRLTIDLSSVHQISEDFVKGGIHTSHRENNAQISINDVIGALENAAGSSKGESQLPPEVEALIDQILKRAVVSENRAKSIPLFSCHSRLPEIKQKQKDTIHKEARSFEGQRLSPLLGEKGSGKPTSQMPSGLDIYEGFKRLRRNDEHVVKWDTRIRGIVENPRNSAPSEINNPAPQNRDPIGNTLPGYLTHQVGKWVSRSLLRGERVIRLQLRPPELGAMKVEMDMKGNVLKLGITTENGVVRELLLTNVHELREALVEQGIKLDRVDVQINHHFDESLANTEERFKGGQRWAHELNGKQITEEHTMEDSVASSLAKIAGNYLLNLIV
jgi:hypothetical protein